MTPHDRLDRVSALWRTAQTSLAEVAVMLAVADDRSEWLRLGYPNFEAYAAQAGIPASSARKLRIVGAVFQDRLSHLVKCGESTPVSTDRLYQAARRVRAGMDVDAAMAEALTSTDEGTATSQPLTADSTEKAVEKAVCPACGHSHNCRPRKPLGEEEQIASGGRR
jgi:hypothetical protein